MKLKHFIDSNKGITFLVMLGMIFYYRQWNNPTAMIYLALHGTYGLMWVMKSRIFPDKQWEQRPALWFGFFSWFALALYWIPGWLIFSRSLQAPAWLLAICVSLYTFGVFFHFASDMQKYTSLELKPGILITDKLFGLARNVNYFGELLIYSAMATLAMTWIAYLPLLAFILFYWIPNMIRKEKSLSRYPNFSTYKQKVRLFFPFLF
jgi:steroid 5-alpha reductase family enzyme